MRIKKFIAPNMQEALSQIRKEFGDDAIILSRKNIYSRENPQVAEGIEITAAIEKQEKEGVEPKNFSENFSRATSQKIDSMQISTAQFGSLQKEIEFISQQMSSLIDHIKLEKLPHIPKPLQQRVRTLMNNGVSSSLANSLIEEMFINMKGEELFHSEEIDERLINKIKSLIRISGPIKFYRNYPTVIPLIGPTGVGKTTTIAKIGTLYKYTHGKKVAIISADSYRIAAMEQLKSFAEVADINFLQVYENSDLLKAINQLADYDLILIDTMGLNPKDMKTMIQLKEMIRVCKADEIFLTLSLSTRSQDLSNIIKNFSVIPFTSMVFTKLDETTYFGDMLNISVEFDKPLSYLTNGQSIPEDIMLADRKQIATLILKGE